MPGSGVIYLDISGVIGPATADHIDHSLGQTEAQQADLVFLRLDRPGVPDTSMRIIIKLIIDSNRLIGL